MFATMKRHLKNWLLPHDGNDHRPHLLRTPAAVFLCLIIILAFGFSVFRGLVVNRSARFTAAVLPAVMINLTNEDRSDEGLSELVINPVLTEAARMKAEHMAEHEYFAHVSPDGLDPWYWFYRAGYVFTDAGENLAVNFSDSEDVVRAWMDSPGHRANILNEKFTEIGIAAVRGKYKGKNTIFIVQMFGRPAKVALAPTPTPTPGTPAAPRATPSVAGASVETVAPVVTVAVASDPPTKLIKETLTARVEGAIEPAPPAGTVAEPLSPFASMGARPRAVVSWIYLVIGLLISFVILLMIYKQVHVHHSRSVLYGCALLALITLLSYFNYLLLSSDLIIV